MYHGDVKNKHNKLCLVANKQGFASIYAMIILQVILAFILLLLSNSKTILAHKQMKNDLHAAQLYALYHVKMHIKQDTQEETATIEDTTREVIEEAQEESEEQTQEEILTYHNQDIVITYSPTYTDITIAHVILHLEIDEDTKIIRNLVYL